jgi:glycerol uptake facilitator-like aquaporin
MRRGALKATALEVAAADATMLRRLLAEFIGSALLAAVVVGSGIAAQRLSPGDVGLELFENAAVTAAGLYFLVLVFAPVSGAHFNPVISLVDAALHPDSWRTAAAYLPIQAAGCIGGAVLANLMFAKPAITLSTHHRSTGAHFLAEVVATAGLVFVVFALAKTARSSLAPAAVCSYIGAAYFFTSSTSFANPAIAVGRMFSNSFAGIAPSSVPAFVGAELVGGVVGLGLVMLLFPSNAARRRPGDESIELAAGVDMDGAHKSSFGMLR